MFKFARVDEKKVHRLVDVKENYMDTELPMKMAPVPPVCIVAPTHIALSENSQAYRNRVLLPFFLLLSLACFYHVKHIYGFWVQLEQKQLEKVEGKKVRHGDQYFLESDHIDDLIVYYQVDVSAGITVSDYLSQRYQAFSMPVFSQYLSLIYLEWVALLGYFFGIPLLLYKLLTYPRRAPIFFDRERQVVFTWRKGKVWLQSYSQLEMFMSSISLSFLLYGLDENDKLCEHYYHIQPTGNILINGKAHYQHSLSAICQFMKRGMDRVWTGEWSEQKGLFLRPDNMPVDLYEQVAKLSERLKA